MTGMLKRKVIVVSGVGPGLGTTLAHRCARDGADLVLAARSAERLDDVAKQIIDTGRRAVAVRTDITDDDDVSNLVQATLAAYGKADVLINNAFRVPSMKPLAGTTFEHIRDAIELSALGTLRLIQAFTPALAQSHGAIVNVNSMVIRHSQPKYGTYKMAKSVLLAMSHSLATELGEQGIRVNSVAPGYIWGDTLKSYFDHQAGKYGTTVDQIYQATAATPISNGCQPKTRWPQRFFSWPATWPAASPGRPWTSIAGSTTRNDSASRSERCGHRRRTARIGYQTGGSRRFWHRRRQLP